MCRKMAYHSKWAHHPKHQKWARHRNHKGFGRFHQAWQSAPVNVQEFDDRYELLVFAPGLSKKDFQISVVDNILTIKADAIKTDDKDSTTTWRRKEYSPGNFTREFELNEKINTETIDAKYKDGILKVTLPKQEGAETFRKYVTIA